MLLTTGERFVYTCMLIQHTCMLLMHDEVPLRRPFTDYYNVVKKVVSALS